MRQIHGQELELCSDTSPVIRNPQALLSRCSLAVPQHFVIVQLRPLGPSDTNIMANIRQTAKIDYTLTSTSLALRVCFKDYWVTESETALGMSVVPVVDFGASRKKKSCF